jgi:ornithine cyclodeaminase/alanine dehydrogenase-like protein (mu-crystallin family)
MSHESGTEILVISGADVRELVSMPRCIELIDHVMRVVSAGRAQLPPRIGAPIPGGNVVATMPGYLEDPPSAGAKVIAVYPENSKRGASSHQGAVVLFDPADGTPLAVIDAHAITGLRTAAASAVATRALARPEASNLTILGTGEQASAHLVAIRHVRQIQSVTVWGRTLGNAVTFAEREGALLGIKIQVAECVQSAVAEADIVCTTTSAREPILNGAWIRKGAHVNLVGASSAQAREADDELIARANVFFDFRASALAQAAELLNLPRERASELARKEIGAVLAGALPGRQSAHEITVYKSLGIAAQDLAVAHYVYTQARPLGRGIRAVL